VHKPCMDGKLEVLFSTPAVTLMRADAAFERLAQSLTATETWFVMVRGGVVRSRMNGESPPGNLDAHKKT
jgi:hypothetical protein